MLNVKLSVAHSGCFDWSCLSAFRESSNLQLHLYFRRIRFGVTCKVTLALPAATSVVGCVKQCVLVNLDFGFKVGGFLRLGILHF